ncbi:hypothetical protein EVAR_97243_1 [Eumeta japonica]|uniref:Uncharacterized protein n=2 Tax=Eumeta variegata TaxID=151549 RepID=A0A4C1ZGL3_EUMVA|nr:hypothetical protein EVAR_97243_1 [Eumeta japonica]
MTSLQLSLGKSDTSKVVKDLTKSPTRARKYTSDLRKRNKEESQQPSSLEALSISSDYECKSSTSEISVKAGPSTANLEVPPKRKRGRKNIFDERLSASLDFAKLSDRKATVVLTSTLKVQPNTPLTVHWDGKLIEDITGHKTVDRLPILVSGQGVDQLWLSQNSVMELGRRVLQLFMTLLFLGTWATKSNVLLRHHCGQYRFKSRCLHFIRTEDRKDALWLACRHHIMEIVLEAVVVQALGPSSGPEILIFKRFRSAWPSIDQRVPNKGISFRAPAGLHRARWMAKAIYCLKLFMFRDQFKMTKRELKAITEVCVFVVMIYIRCWYQAPLATSAPRNDLWLLNNLKKFENINKAISKKALTKFLGHLWYLSEELVAFAFFDDEISIECKQKMVIALSEEGSEYSPKRITLDISHIEEKSIENFVNSNTLRFFTILGIPSTFLQKEPRLWEEDEDYKASREIVRSMRVVNDIAERGVALIEEFNKIITSDEEQKQFLLLVVKKFRQMYPDTKKSTLLA